MQFSRSNYFVDEQHLPWQSGQLAHGQASPHVHAAPLQHPHAVQQQPLPVQHAAVAAVATTAEAALEDSQQGAFTSQQAALASQQAAFLDEQQLPDFLTLSLDADAIHVLAHDSQAAHGHESPQVQAPPLQQSHAVQQQALPVQHLEASWS